METTHNPDRFMAELRQILSQGRKRIALLVGAGAPISLKVNPEGRIDDSGKPLIPGVEQLTSDVLQSLTGVDKTAADAIAQELGPDANIERILSKVRLLQVAIGTSQVNGLNAEGYANLGKNICAKIAEIVGPELPKEKCSYTELVSWISGTNREHAVEIFCTNYDLLFEEAFERSRAPYFDGFTGGASPFFDPVSVAGNDLPARWSRLWKIHGSLGWAVVDGTVVRGRGRDQGELVYPDHLKYDLTQKQPYSALFERLRSFLLAPDTLLLTVGFSFRDAHICAVLDEALAMNSNTAVFAFQFGDLDPKGCAEKIAFDRPNLSVYAANGAVVSGVMGAWRPGDMPKNWAEIRASFWGKRGSDASAPAFLLGDFSLFSRFCALTQATDLIESAAPAVIIDSPTGDVTA